MNSPISIFSGASRRDLLKGSASLVGAAALLAATRASAQSAPSAAGAPAAAPAASGADLDLVNQALGLEQLQQAFYDQVLAAQANAPYLHERLSAVVPIIRDHEAAHVAALMQVVGAGGGTPTTAATYKFPAAVFVSPFSFMEFAYTLEDIGVGAYLGALRRLRSPELRAAAYSIYAIEAQHSALLRQVGGYLPAPRYYEGPLSTEQVTALLAPYIA